MPPITIQIIVDNANSAAQIDQVTQQVQQLGTAGKTAGEGLNQGSSALSDFGAAGALVTAGLALAGTQAVQFASHLNEIGDQSRRASAALDALTNGKADQWMNTMTANSHGLVDGMTLAHDASMALSAGVVSNAAEMGKLVNIGSTLGETFMNDAAGGVTAVTLALEGNTRGLKQMGLSATDFTSDYKKLVKEGMEPAEAKLQALVEVSSKSMKALSGQIDDGPGAAMDRLNTKWKNFEDKAGEKVSIVVDAVLNWTDKNPTLTTQILGGLAGGVAGPGGKYFVDSMTGNLPTQQSGGGTSGVQAAMGSGWNGGVHRDSFGDLVDAQGNVVNGSFGNAYLQSEASTPGGVRGRRGSAAPAGSSAAAMATADAAASRGDMGYTDLETEQRVNAQMLARSGSPYTSSELSARRNANAGYDVTGPAQIYGGMAEKIAAAKDQQVALSNATSLWNTALKDAGAFVTGFGDEMRKDKAVADGMFTSVSQAFGLKSGGIGGEIGGGLAQDAAAERANLVKHGATKSQLATFDAQSKDAINQYQIATGQATPESIKFADAISSVNTKVAAGKETMAQAAKDYLALADAASKGTATIANIDKIIGVVNNSPGYGGGSAGMFNDRPGGAAGAQKQTSAGPFAAYEEGAKNTIELTGKIGPEMQKQVAVAQGANAAIAKSYDPILAKQLAVIANQKMIGGGNMGGRGGGK